MKKYLAIFIFMSILILSIQQSSAVPVYVGIRVDNLTDDPSNSCAGISGTGYDYGSQGRVRAIAAILPTYPIYYNLSKVSDGSTIWAGDGTDDTDYGIGDIMYLPASVDLTIGEDYNIFFDIDALRIYLPLTTTGSFTATVDDNYYTIGDTTDTSGSGFVSVDYGCTYAGTYGAGTTHHAVYDDRTITDSRRVGGTVSYEPKDFKIDGKYANLYTSSVGNFNIAFTMT
jgi:hypothetical protein